MVNEVGSGNCMLDLGSDPPWEGEVLEVFWSFGLNDVLEFICKRECIRFVREKYIILPVEQYIGGSDIYLSLFKM